MSLCQSVKQPSLAVPHTVSSQRGWSSTGQPRCWQGTQSCRSLPSPAGCWTDPSSLTSTAAPTVAKCFGKGPILDASSPSFRMCLWPLGTHRVSMSSAEAQQLHRGMGTAWGTSADFGPWVSRERLEGGREELSFWDPPRTALSQMHQWFATAQKHVASMRSLKQRWLKDGPFALFLPLSSLQMARCWQSSADQNPTPSVLTTPHPHTPVPLCPLTHGGAGAASPTAAQVREHPEHSQSVGHVPPLNPSPASSSS